MKVNARTSEKIEKLRSTTESISYRQQFFHWELQFPEVFYQGAREKNEPGFDAVIGNPPYGTISDKTATQLIRHIFSSFQGNLENYGLFAERSLELSRSDGRASLIVPVTWCQNPQFSRLRALVLSWSLEKLIELPRKVFEDSDLDTSIFIVQKTISSDDRKTMVRSCRNDSNVMISLGEEGVHVAKESWISMGGKLSFKTDVGEKSLFSKIRSKSNPLGDFFDYSQGLVPYAREEMYRTMSKDEADRIVDERLWHSNKKEGPEFKRELRGDDVDIGISCHGTAVSGSNMVLG